jgi:hypothetical protein
MPATRRQAMPSAAGRNWRARPNLIAAQALKAQFACLMKHHAKKISYAG